jgi:PGF-CTERM protein
MLCEDFATGSLCGVAFAIVRNELAAADSTDDSTPGSGAVVALVALIGAALLALGRRN